MSCTMYASCTSFMYHASHVHAAPPVAPFHVALHVPCTAVMPPHLITCTTMLRRAPPPMRGPAPREKTPDALDIFHYLRFELAGGGRPRRLARQIDTFSIAAFPGRRDFCDAFNGRHSAAASHGICPRRSAHAASPCAEGRRRSPRWIVSRKKRFIERAAGAVIISALDFSQRSKPRPWARFLMPPPLAHFSITSPIVTLD